MAPVEFDAVVSPDFGGRLLGNMTNAILDVFVILVDVAIQAPQLELNDHLNGWIVACDIKED